MTTNADGGRDLGLVGLGTMGAALAANAVDHGFGVAGWDLSPETTARVAAALPAGRCTPAADLGALVAALERPRRVLVMVPAGAPVDAVLERLVPALSPGDVVIDGGNSDWHDTRRRGERLTPSGLHFVGMGVSGGEEGARRGPALMPGGSEEAWQRLRPLLEAIAAKTEAGPCVSHVGPGAAGHFVKMVHNGIEYAEMQLLAEAVDVLHRGLALSLPAVADALEAWNRGPLASFLVELSAQVLRAKDPDGGGPLVERVADRTGQKGTGRWTVEAALDLAVPAPTIAAAVDARVVSGAVPEREATCRAFGGRVRAFEGVDRAAVIGEVEQALLAGRIVAWSQGIAIVRAASQRERWNVDARELLRTWKGGCIVRAAVIDLFRDDLERVPDLPLLALGPEASRRLADAEGGWRRVTAAACEGGLPVPCLASALSWFDALRAERLPAWLVAAQRDAFGAHGYDRRDGSGRAHSRWD